MMQKSMGQVLAGHEHFADKMLSGENLKLVFLIVGIR